MKNCKKSGNQVHGDFIISLPGETKETINKTIDFAKELIAKRYGHRWRMPCLERNFMIRWPKEALKVEAGGSAVTNCRTSSTRIFRSPR